MKANSYTAMRGMLVGYLKEFQQLEQEEPEIAKRLGFEGYVHFSTLCLFGNEQHEVLERVAENTDVLRKS